VVVAHLVVQLISHDFDDLLDFLGLGKLLGLTVIMILHGYITT